MINTKGPSDVVVQRMHYVTEIMYYNSGDPEFVTSAIKPLVINGFLSWVNEDGSQRHVNTAAINEYVVRELK